MDYGGQGVPASAITLDYAGFRTLDSIVRAKEIFGQTRLTIILVASCTFCTDASWSQGTTG